MGCILLATEGARQADGDAGLFACVESEEDTGTALSFDTWPLGCSAVIHFGHEDYPGIPASSVEFFHAPEDLACPCHTWPLEGGLSNLSYSV